jgi:hypothetical protein
VGRSAYDRYVGINLPPLVPIDFNGIVAPGHVLLNTMGVDWGLARLGLTLGEGMRLRGYDLDAEEGKPDNLVTEGTVERWISRNDNRPLWVLRMDYLKHQSDLADQPEHWAHHTNFVEEDAALFRWRDEKLKPQVAYRVQQRREVAGWDDKSKP